LQTWATLHASDATAWQQLGLAWQQLGLPLRGLRAEAESRVALGDYNGAVDRLRAAQKLARSSSQVDFIDASVIDSRLRDVQRLQRQQMLEEKPEG
jgi:predicted Zn-dependent protease